MYRDLAEPGPRCTRHPAAPSKATCTRCGAHVCEPCGLYEGLRVTCPACQRARNGKRRLGAWAAIVTVGLAAGVIARHVTDPYHWGARGAAIRDGLAQLKKTPCDAATITGIVGELAAAGDAGNVRAIFDATTENCSLPPEVHRVAFEYFYAVGDYRRAAAEATRLIRVTRYTDAAAFEWRARAYREADMRAAADADERSAQRLRAPAPSALVGL